jgi:phosphatidylglycerophosphatase A
LVLATWFGCGYSPAAPGTAGSLAAVLIAAALWQAAALPAPVFLLAGVLLIVPGAIASRAAAASSGVEDPGMVVVDEVAGQWIAIGGALTLNYRSLIAAFVLFRLFDIWKPGPIRSAEALPHGWGIMADDVLAGAAAALVLFTAGWFNLY